ncbi:hypothetical protein BV25DRAFT_1922919, partial [Artomyces pyxidatus]
MAAGQNDRKGKGKGGDDAGQRSARCAGASMNNEEREWLEQQSQAAYADYIQAGAEAEAVVASGGKAFAVTKKSFINRVFDDFGKRFSVPRPEETEEAFKVRQKADHTSKKRFMTKKRAETMDEMDTRVASYRLYIVGFVYRRMKEIEEGDKSKEALARIDPIKVAAARGATGWDVFFAGHKWRPNRGLGETVGTW